MTISCNRLSRWAGAAFVLQFVGISIAVDLFRLFGIAYTDAITAIILYAPSIIAFCLLLPNALQTKQARLIYLCLWLVICLTMIWFVVDRWDAPGIIVPTLYDSKRPYFFLQGVTLAGFIGVFAATNWRGFAWSFMKWTLVLSILACGLYISTYHINSSTGRFGGATALQHAIAFSSGVSCAFALLFLTAKGIFRSWLFTPLVLWASIVFLAAGIVISGTRAALLGAIVSGLVYIFFMSRRGKLRRMFIVVCGLTVLFFIAILWLPSDSIDRISQIEQGGLDQRTRLSDLAFVSFANHPFGKTRDYLQVFEGRNYAHDTILQMLLEVGIIGAPILLIILFLALKNAIKYFRSDPVMSGFMLVLLYLILQSFSSGSAYNPEFWFSVMFLATLVRRNLYNNCPGAYNAAVPACTSKNSCN